MTLKPFLAPADWSRVHRTLRKLATNNIAHFALTGGLAIETHLLLAHRPPLERDFNDLDFIVPAFADIPRTLTNGFLFRHVHPDDLPGKNLLQCIDPETKLRIDLFRAYGSEMKRLIGVEIAGVSIRMVSLGDMAARHARLSWDLTDGKAVPSKFARDFLRMSEVISCDEVQHIWPEHRKAQMPATFADAVARLRAAIQSRPDLLVAPGYSTDVHKVCDRCKEVADFPLARGGQILSILGYC
jgi:hypothetical protein